MNSGALLVEITKQILDSVPEVHLQLKGNCMWPVLRNGDLVRIQKTSRETLRFGDVAIYQTTPQTFHANIIFNAASVSGASGYLGKAVEIERNGKRLELDPRSFSQRFFQALLCPSNPYVLGLPAYLFRKFFRRNR